MIGGGLPGSVTSTFRVYTHMTSPSYVRMGAFSQWSIPMHGFDVIDGGGATFGPAEMK